MKYQCPCCGYYTFKEPLTGTYDICPVCFWEDDAIQYEYPNESGANCSLLMARKNFIAYGACDKAMVKEVRPPKESEKKGQAWSEEARLRLQEKIDEVYMAMAIKEAKKAAKLEEVPIGCVIVHGTEVIAKGYNKRNTKKSTLAHAEMLCIKKACKKLEDWRVEDCTMYITLEPCQMCAGAIVQARIPRVVIGAMNKKAGCAGSILNLLEMQEFNHRVDVTRGILEEACSELMKDFFKEMREKRKQEKEAKKQDGCEH